MSVVGRFAPTPSGRLHLGNVMCALLAYLSAKSQGGENVLRIEDLDFQRCAFGDNANVLMDDLRWLGLVYDRGYNEESFQSRRFSVYERYFERLRSDGRVYPCYCSRAELHAATAPHGSDGQPLYDGKCRRLFDEGVTPATDKTPSYRLRVPDETVAFVDGVQGEYKENLAREAGDFILRRADGVYAYQLAVVIDDALSGVTEVVRGRDLLSSTPRQIYLYRLFGFTPPAFYHVPLVVMPDGRRLSKRDGDLDIGAFRRRFQSPEPLLGYLGHAAGLLERAEPVTVAELAQSFSWDKIPKNDILLPKELLE